MIEKIQTETLLFKIKFLLSMAYMIPTQKSTYTIPTSSNNQSRINTLSAKKNLDYWEATELAKLSGVPEIAIVKESFGTVSNPTSNVLNFINSNKPATITPISSIPSATKFENVPKVQTIKTVEKYTIPAQKYTIPIIPTAEKYTIPEQTTKSSTISTQAKTPSIPSVSKSVSATSQITVPILSKAIPSVTNSVPTIPQIEQPALSSSAQKVPELHIQQVDEREIELKLAPEPDVQPIIAADEVTQIAPVPDVQPTEVYDMDGNRVDAIKKSTPKSSDVVKVDGISTIPKPKEAKPIDVYDENYQPIYVGASIGEAKILDSFYQAMENYHDTWPIYEDHKQQCIQDAALAIKLWREALASDDDPSNDNWYKFARMATLSEEWHAIVAVSPYGSFAFPEKDHLFDPRDNIYRGTVRNFDSDSEYSVEIYDKFDTVTKTDENGNDYEEATWLDPNRSHVSQQFVPNSDTEAEGLKSSYNEVEQIKIDELQNKRVDQENFQVIPDGEIYYTSKTNPDYVISNWTYENVIIGDIERNKLQKMNPDGTVYVSKEDENSHNKITVSNIYSSMTTKQVAFSLAKQIYGDGFSIPQMVDIYQFVQKYSTNGKFDINKLTEINKELNIILEA